MERVSTANAAVENVPLQHHIAFTSNPSFTPKASFCSLQKINVERIKLVCGETISTPQEWHRRTSYLEALNIQQHAQGKNLKPNIPPIGCLTNFNRKRLMSVSAKWLNLFSFILWGTYLCENSYIRSMKFLGVIQTRAYSNIIPRQTQHVAPLASINVCPDQSPIG